MTRHEPQLRDRRAIRCRHRLPGHRPGPEGSIPELNGETVITRYTLRELLDKLDELRP
ncbi:MAG TPA: hypothetical protein VFV73_45295 [Streptosporangiaceae bacterium]|nr:hypothetical protein [Streptosporangiaceae bacterium]